MELGNLASRMRLECKPCGERFPDDTRMEAVQLHCQVEHDTDEVILNLVATCSCAAAMELVNSRPTGGGMKDYFRCPACGNTGFTKRDQVFPQGKDVS